MLSIKKLKEEIGFIGIILFVVAAIVPIIVRWADVPVPPELSTKIPRESISEFFSYHRSWVLMVCAGAIGLYKLSDLVISWPDMDDIKKSVKALYKDPVICMASVYMLFVLLSNILSPYPNLAMWGIYDRREGLFVQLSYMTIFLTAMFYLKDSYRIKFILSGFFFSSLVMGIIGITQFIGQDFLTTTEIGRLLIAPNVTRLSTPFDMSYGTTFNPNTFGLVTAMLFPLLFAAAMAWENRIGRGLFTLAGILMLFGVVASRSVGGFIGAGAAFAVIITVLVVRRFVQKPTSSSPRKAGMITAICFIMVLGLGIGLGVSKPIQDSLSFTMGRIAAIFVPPNIQHPEFEFNGNRVTVTDKGITYHIDLPLDSGAPQVSMPDGTIIEATMIPDEATTWTTHVYQVPGLGNVVIDEESATFRYREILFTLQDNEIRLVYRGGELIDPQEPIASWGFVGWETWGSNRGYIFSRTIPLLPRSLFIGKGSDTFMLQFPQHDVISNLRYFNNPYMLVDKAHNLYLQTAVTTGVISALAIIGIFGYYIVTGFLSIVKSCKEEDPFKFWLKVGVLASVSAFAVSSLATDSTVSSTPIFWIIIGMGYALNKGDKENSHGRGTH